MYLSVCYLETSIINGFICFPIFVHPRKKIVWEEMRPRRV